MKSISVFCGSSSGYESIYKENAIILGESLAKKGIRLIYGGADIGLMGAMADAALRNGGEVVGIIPGFLQDKEIAHKNLTELIITTTMHERKAKMADLCDGVIAMPGGFGTLEEFFEMLTWGQLMIHSKPVALLNIDGYYDDLMRFLENSVEKGFLKQENFDMIIIDDEIERLLDKMEQYQSPKTGKWIG